MDLLRDKAILLILLLLSFISTNFLIHLTRVKFEILFQELVVGVVVDLADHQDLVDVGPAAQALDLLSLLLDDFDLDLEEEG